MKKKAGKRDKPKKQTTHSFIAKGTTMQDWNSGNGGKMGGGSFQNGSSKSDSGYAPCHKSHPALKLNDGLVIYGGSCHTPVVKDADIYVGLDAGMYSYHRSKPWTGIIEVPFFVQDCSIPKDAQEFPKLIAWLAEQIVAGKKVHVGCIGGHGRTGMLLSALVAHMKVSADPITYVRQHYCKKAVESETQVSYLVREFGCKRVQASKAHLPSVSTGSKSGSKDWWFTDPANKPPLVGEKAVSTAQSGRSLDFVSPIDHPGRIW